MNRLIFFGFIIQFGLWLGNFAGAQRETSYRTTEESPYDDEANNDYEADYQEIYDLLNVDEIENQLNSVDSHVDFSRVIEELAKGSEGYVGEVLLAAIRDSLFGELLLNKSLMIQIVTIVLFGSIFVNLASSFGTGFVSENGFYVTYLIITSIMLVSFLSTIDMVSSSIEKVLTLIKIIVPLYALAMNFVGQTVASAGMYQVIMVVIGLVQLIILKFIIPMIKFYVVISLINNLNKEDNFSKLCNLVMNIVNWVLKTVVYFIVGLNLIKGLIEPQIDALGRNTVNRVATLIPGGTLVTALTSTFLGAGMVVKNSVGVAGIIVVLISVMVPIVKLVIIMLTVRITAAMIQPIGEKRYVEGVEAVAKGNQMLLHTLFSSVVLFMLTIAIVSYSAKGI